MLRTVEHDTENTTESVHGDGAADNATPTARPATEHSQTPELSDEEEAAPQSSTFDHVDYASKKANFLPPLLFTPLTLTEQENPRQFVPA